MKEKKKLSYPKKVTRYTLMKILAMTVLLVLVAICIKLYPDIPLRYYVSIFATACTVLTFVFLYRDVYIFPSRERTRAFLGSLAIQTFFLIVVGLSVVWLVDGTNGFWVYTAMIVIPTSFAIVIASFDQAHREQATSKVHYGCDRIQNGSYVVYVVYQFLMYIVFPFGIFLKMIKYSNFGLVLTAVYFCGGLLFTIVEHNNRKHKKRSIFWKDPISKK